MFERAKSELPAAREHDARVRAKALADALRAVNEGRPYTPDHVYAEIRNALERLATSGTDAEVGT